MCQQQRCRCPHVVHAPLKWHAFLSPIKGTFDMFSYIVNRVLYLQQSLVYSILQPFNFFSRIISPYIEKLTCANKSPNDPESRVPFDTQEGPSTCETYTVRLEAQYDLDILGVGASGQVYNVSDKIVLKTCRIFVPPSSDASRSDLWHYASDTLFYFNLLKETNGLTAETNFCPLTFL
jgi:hypothetical protein